ncbi:MAG: DUF523 domain-containing protein [Firmicutes bacterium]|nr:DUF523 domain-containing protein [Bacillota bacterium]
MFVVSSCLLGQKCRYNATDCYRPALLETLSDNYIKLCPELLAGLSIPRLPCEIVGGGGKEVLRGNAVILDRQGADITDVMVAGARKAAEICRQKGVTRAYLKSNSPTCGCGQVFDGSFTGTLTGGNGLFAELLLQNGIDVVSIS